MPKISALSALAAAALTGAALAVVVDTTDLSMAPTGTTKKITMADVRTKVLAGGTGFASNDPINVGGLATFSNDVRAGSDNTLDIGTSGTRFRTILAYNFVAANVGAVFSATGATTGNRYIQINNTGGQAYLGVESSVGGTIVTGSTAYDSVLTGQTGLTFSANNGTNVHMRIASTGVTTFPGANVVNIGKAFITRNAADTRFALYLSNQLAWSGGGTDDNGALGTFGSMGFYVNNSNTATMVIATSGVTTFSNDINVVATGNHTLLTLSTTGNAAESITSSDSSGYASMVFVRTATSAYVGLDKANQLITGSADNDLAIRAPTAIIFSTNGGTNIHGKMASGIFLWSNAAVSAGAASGDIVIANSKFLRGVNNAASTTIAMIGVTTGDVVNIAGAPNIVSIGGPATTASAATGDLVFANGSSIRAANAAGTDTLSMIRLSSYTGTNVVVVGLASIVAIGGPASVVNANAGEIVVANGRGMRASNAAGNAARQMISLDATNRILLAGDGDSIMWGTATVALGGGAAPTLGTIGGGGPAVAAQNEWMKVITAAGNTRWIALWA